VPASGFRLVDAGPAFTPLPYGLLSAAEVVDETDPHLGLGSQVENDLCIDPLSLAAACVNGSGPTLTAIPVGPPSSAAMAFRVYAWVDCAPIGQGPDAEDLTRRIDQAFTNGESRALEHVVWTGTTTLDSSTVYPHLAANAADVTAAEATLAGQDQGQSVVELQTAATAVTSAAVDLVEAVGLVERELGRCYGGVGVIHVPRWALAHLSHLSLAERYGERLRTLGGHLIAAYSPSDRHGPDGTEPAAGQGWIYGTGAVQVRRSPIKAPSPLPAQFVGRQENRVTYVTYRYYSVDWACCHVAAQVSLGGAITGTVGAIT
jgi:hypothetical protein